VLLIAVIRKDGNSILWSSLLNVENYMGHIAAINRISHERKDRIK
jgi:hypothetical protein